MYLKSLKINNLRQFRKVSFEFDPQMTLVHGNNTTGKSTILEAIYLVFNGHSPWTHKKAELVNYNTSDNFVRVEAELCEEVGNKTKLNKKSNKHKTANQIKNSNKTHTISFFYASDGSITRKLNGRKVNTYEISKYFTSNLFSPDQIDMLMFSPEQRRRFINDLFCRLDLDYNDALVNFRKTLQQRNAYLKTLSRTFQNRQSDKSEINSNVHNNVDQNIYNSQLRYWSDELAKYGAYLEWKRRELLQKLSTNCRHLTISYKPDLGSNNPEQFVDMADLAGLIHLYQNYLKASIWKDLARGFTTVGVQLDDWELRITDKEYKDNDKNGRDLKRFGSRGEKRMNIGNVILGSQSLLQKSFGYFPILLLDDISSELDSRNTQLFLENKRVQQQQTIATCLEIPEFLKKEKIIRL